MSYTTRCPACGTTFRVVPDQLKISDGWVRCGYCSDVFDATLSLQDWPAENVAPAPAEPDAPAAEPGAPSPAPADPADDGPPVSEAVAQDWEDSGWQDSDFLADLHRYAQRARSTDADAAPVSAPVPMPAVSPPQAPAPEVPPSPLPPPPPPPPPSAPGPATEPKPTPAPVQADEPAGPQAPALPDFVVQARRRAFWSSPGVRALLALLALALGGLLLVQWAWHERDQVAARWPAVRPLLQSACGMAGCEIAPVRRIDDVVIDSSHLARRLGTFYVFDLVLRNKADVPVAVPALELSLTDPRDQVLSRRVFLAHELPGAPVVVPARGSLDLALNLSISLADTAAMSGYRALLFYP